MAGEAELILVALMMTLVFLSLIIVYARRFVRVPPNKAMVIYGSGMGRRRAIGRDGRPITVGGFDIVVAGGRFVPPIVKDFAFLPLELLALEIAIQGIPTDSANRGPRMHLKAGAQVKIASDEASLRKAAEALLGRTDKEVGDAATMVIEAAVRSAAARITIQEIAAFREGFAESVLGKAAAGLAGIGMEIKSLVLREVEDEHGLLDAQSRRRTAEAIRDARVGEAQARREASTIDASKLGESWETRLEGIARRLDKVERRLEDEESGDK